jgi:hypothetical protein
MLKKMLTIPNTRLFVLAFSIFAHLEKLIPPNIENKIVIMNNPKKYKMVIRNIL